MKNFVQFVCANAANEILISTNDSNLIQFGGAVRVSAAAAVAAVRRSPLLGVTLTLIFSGTKYHTFVLVNISFRASFRFSPSLVLSPLRRAVSVRSVLACRCC